jgi:hypothetical protein
MPLSRPRARDGAVMGHSDFLAEGANGLLTDRQTSVSVCQPKSASELPGGHPPIGRGKFHDLLKCDMSERARTSSLGFER